MKFLFEFFPVVVFFIIFKMYDIFYATAAIILCMLLQLIWLYVRKQPISRLQQGSFLLVVILGGVTLALRDATFIKIKPTVFYWMVSIAFFVSAWFFQKNLVKTLLGGQIELPDSVWKHLNIGWIVFFFILGILNLVVAYWFSEDVWVTFKLVGTTVLMLLFFLGQGLYISKYISKT